MSRRQLSSATDARRVVRLARPLGLCQLFRPLPKDGVKRPPLEERYEYAGVQWHFHAPEALGVTEQTLLLVLLEMAAEQYRRDPRVHTLDGTHSGGVGGLLWRTLFTGSSRAAEAQTIGRSTLRLSFSWSEIHRRCGSTSTGGAVTQARRRSLQQLAEVTVEEHIQASGQQYCARLLSWARGDDGRAYVALHPVLSAAVTSPDYAQVSLTERLALPTPTAMLVHAFLSTCVWQGKSLQIQVETVVRRLWPNPAKPAPSGTARHRRDEVKKALQAIGRLARWRVEFRPSGMVMVRRQGSPSGSREASHHQPSPQTSAAPKAVREMTGASHFALPSTSYGQRPFWANASTDKNLRRNDGAGSTS